MPITRTYAYDTLDRLTSMTSTDGCNTAREITHITYSPTDNPLYIEADNDDMLARYGYSATGQKLFKQLGLRDSEPMPENPISRLYIGPFEFTGIANSAIQLDRVNLSWGYFDGSGSQYLYVKDYQGNIRQVTSGSGVPIQYNDYYPYGMPINSWQNSNAGLNPYKYGGKEFETANGLDSYDFEARTLTPSVCLFTSPDPKAHKTPDVSPYLYCAANPIMFIDPTGEELVLKGNEDDINSIINIYQEAIGNTGTISWDKDTGIVSLERNGESSESNLEFDTLKEIVDAEGTVSINVERDTNVLIGDVSTGTVDIGDIERLGSDKPVTSIGALFHETVEQYNIQLKGMDFRSAHNNASRLESKIIGYAIHPDREMCPDNRYIRFNMIILHRKGCNDGDLGFKKYILPYNIQNNIIK